MPINSFEDYPMSWKPDRRSLKRPIYLALAAQLEQDISQGYLVAGTKLPPQRELADFLDINFTTVTRAYRLCELKGIIHAVTGRGTFVSQYATQSATMSIVQKTEQPIIDLGFVASFEQCNQMIVETVRSVTEKPYFEQLLNYNYPSGMPHHKMAGMAWMQRFGIETDAEHIAVVSGTQNGLALVLSALFSPGDRIAVDSFTYANLIELAKLYRLHLIPVPGDGHGMLPSNLEAQCKLNRPKGIFLMPSCCNPTTVMMSETRKQELAGVIQRHRLILIEDDIHAFLTAGIVSDYQGPVSRFLPDNFVYLCGTSKSICSGLRIAYLVFSGNLKETILKAVYNINVKTSSLDAEIITELILNGTANRIVQEKYHLAQNANQLFEKYFPQQATAGHPVSFYRWLPIQSKKSGIWVERQYQTAGVRVFHSDRFLCGTAQEQRFLRVSLATAASPEELEKGFIILRKTLKYEEL